MSIDFTINGHRYTNDPVVVLSANVPPEYQFIGYNAVVALGSLAADTVAVVSNAAQSALAAATSAASAAMSPNTNAATDGTATPMILGETWFTIPAGKSFVKGNSVKVASADNARLWAYGDVLSYDGDDVSGAPNLLIDLQRVQVPPETDAVLTFAIVSLSGPAFADGPVGGSMIGPISSDLVLTVESARLIAVTPTKAGLSVYLPDATTLMLGAENQPIIRSIPGIGQNFDLAIRDFTGKLLGFAPAGGEVQSELLDNPTEAGAWALRGVSATGTTAFAQLVLAASVGGTGGTFIRTCAADPNNGNLNLIIVHGTSVHAVLYDETSHQFGAPVLIRSGLSTAGADGNVVAALASNGWRTFGVLICSLTENSTALQSVLVHPNGLGLTVDAPVSTTLAAAAARLVSLDGLVGGSLLAYMVGTTAFHTIAIDCAGGAPVLGTDVANATVGSCAVLPVNETLNGNIAANGTSTYIVLTSSATLITAKGYTMSGTSQTAGGTTTTPATAASNVKTAMINPRPAAATYMVSLFGTTMKGTLLSMAATTPAFSAPVALSPLTTVTSATLIPVGGESGASGALAVISGTDASGRFVIDLTFLDVNGALQGTTIRRAFGAAPTVAFFGQNSANGLMSVAAYSTKEAVMFTIDSAALSIAAESRTGALSMVATAPGAASTTDIRTAVARNTIASLGTGQAAVLGDGSKSAFVNRGQSVLSTANGGMLPIADMTLAAKGIDSSEAWIAFNQAPDTAVTIQKVRVA